MTFASACSRVTLSAVLAAFVAGCGGTPVDGVVHLAPRAAGGVTVIGAHSEYDGLSEHESISYVRVDLDDSGQVLSRDDISEQVADTFPTLGAPLAFADGTTLDVIPTVIADPASGDPPGPQVVRGLDPQGNELWRTTLPIESIVLQCADSSGARIISGTPVQTALETSWHYGIVVLELTAEGAIVWQRPLH